MAPGHSSTATGKAYAYRLKLRASGIVLSLILAGTSVWAWEKDKTTYGEGLIVNVPMPQNEVARAVEDVVQNGVIRGTQEYAKDEYITGAKEAGASRAFPAWTEGGKVFYKVHEHTIDPTNFKNSGDLGTLTVRYVVMDQGGTNTVLRIDAVFVEGFRHSVHASSGSVESAEFADIQKHLDAIEVMKKLTREAERQRTEQATKKFEASGSTSRAADQTPSPTATLQSEPPSPAPSISPPSGDAPAESLEQRATELRKKVERLVKAPGAPLKSAPFRTASTLQSLTTGAKVLILINSPYWYGVETQGGQHGWMLRDDVELLP
jgi:hypothetical protein